VFASSDATLSNLTISSGTLTPTFTSGTTTYTASLADVPFVIIIITPMVHQPDATVTVNDIPNTSGSASQSIALAEGSKTITGMVTSQDGITEDTYTINVKRSTSKAGDFDGDGQSDPSVYDPANGNWFILQSTTSILRALNLGFSGAVPLP
jgi:hypothetical protein